MTKLPPIARACACLLGACALMLGTAAGSAWAAASDPVFVFTPMPAAPPASPMPPPAGDLEDPCGLVVDVSGNLYLSDYYHHAVDVFSMSSSNPAYKLQLAGEDSVDGPCGLALDSTGTLYVNNFHHNVVRYTPSVYPLTAATTFSAEGAIDSDEPTGVAVDPNSNHVYVDDRTNVKVYDTAGALLEEIGLGSLGEGYGLAFSAGRVYVPDAASQTVKVFEPSVSTSIPVTSIAGPTGGFHSLVDSAVAVDRVSGAVYVADAVGSPFSEHPETTIDVFNSAGTYEGHLKYNVVNGSPVGLAVDNSVGVNQGRVYVTSGNTAAAGVYAYGPAAATTAPSEPAVLGLGVSTSGTGTGSVASEAEGMGCSGACAMEAPAGQELTLAATPDPGSAFAGWTGAGCSGTGLCVVAMDKASTVDAAFEALSSSPVAPAVSTPAPGTSASKPQTKKPGRAKRHHRAKHHRHHHRGRTN